ncbi:hypothetical protein FA95DRAFT_1600673 [Auriscalpium vulgare]|uniref:Uncharacterized protein n=1 Tax=Auriscalpium vulgare TaxID=40419 RepID=A0ACB8SBD3_9AGAM|nr:hypothetical protein FA95DRAFT_1600673 [Auriscalpium vulgare]
MSSIRDLARPHHASPGYPANPGYPSTLVSASSTSVPATPLVQPTHNAHRSPATSLQTSLLSPPSSFHKRLLMPTVRPPRSPSRSTPASPVLTAKSPRIKPTTSKRIRSRSASSSTASPDFSAAKDLTLEWFGRASKFDIVHDTLELEGFQIYAVEKWYVYTPSHPSNTPSDLSRNPRVTERTRPVITLAVFTGDPTHKITVTAFTPSSHLNPTDAQLEWDRVLRDLRQAGARPRETEHGTLMVTSLANFRSDYTIVHIPSGFFLEARERLYTNINLLRMGCSGRMALTLEEPGDTTKDRFIGMYHMDDKIRASELFCVTILELVKLIQAALSLFGMFDSNSEERDGLLCDVTVDGIQRWVTDIGEPSMGVEPTERVADPTVVCALLSHVAVVRNKLYALGFGQYIPKDPFLDPQRFLQAIANFQASRLFTGLPSTTQGTPILQSTAPHSTQGLAGLVPVIGAAQPILTDDILSAIDVAYDKSRTTESYKVHRVLLNKLDDSTQHVMTEPTADMTVFIRFVQGRASKDGVPSLRWLWSGRAEALGRKGKDKDGVGKDGGRERIWSDGEEEERERVDRERDGPGEDFSTGEENDYKVWSSKRVQRKLESWTGLNRGKKQSADFSARSGHKSHGHHHHHSHSHVQAYDMFHNGHGQSPVPQVVVSRDGEDDEILSSGQVSPISETHNLLGVALPTAESSTVNLSDYDRRVSEFNHRRPLKGTQFRMTSWSDPRSALDTLPDDASARSGSVSDGFEAMRGAHHAREETIRPGDESSRKIRLSGGLKRRRSFDDASALRHSRILPLDRMKIDVDLCGQLLIMQRREKHLAGVVSTLEILTSILSQTNARLRSDYDAHIDNVGAADARTKVIAEVESARGKVATVLQETRALAYETSQFNVPDLWHAVAPQRHKVLALRQKVFDTGRRAPGVYGRFSRLQWTLDGAGRLVDRMGQTVDDAAEEVGMPEMFEDEDEDIGGGERAAAKPAPSWLLKMFASWGTRWKKGPAKDGGAEGKADGHGDGLEAGASASASGTALSTDGDGAGLRERAPSADAESDARAPSPSPSPNVASPDISD